MHKAEFIYMVIVPKFWYLFVGKNLYGCQNFNMTELFHMKINSDAESLSKVDVKKKKLNEWKVSGQNKNVKNKTCYVRTGKIYLFKNSYKEILKTREGDYKYL